VLTSGASSRKLRASGHGGQRLAGDGALLRGRYKTVPLALPAAATLRHIPNIVKVGFSSCPEWPVKHLSVVIATTVLAAACAKGSDTARTDSTSAPAAAATTGNGVDLTGAGATFPQPIYLKWFSDYAAKTGVKINYQPIGSGGGIRQLSEQTVDFGASDAPMTDDEMAKAKGGPIVHIPTVLGAVVVTYNAPGITQPIRLTGELVGDIFLGRVRKWNDSRIAALNPGVSLPNSDVLVVHRSDGSGTTYIFTDYLSAVSAAWKSGPGKGKDIKWPTGLGARGNDGVAGLIKQSPGTIGYVELAFAKQNKLPTAAIKNAAGQFVEPSIDAVTAAAAGAAAKLPPNTDYRLSIVNAPGAAAYPISSFTWILAYQNQPNAEKGRKLLDFLKWALHDGEQSAPSLDYAPLPGALVTRLDATIAAIKVGATP
jgi:phosphate transport system substrate-binding protein